MKVLITGAGGYLGRCLLRRLARRPDLRVLATDVAPPPDADGPFEWAVADVCDRRLGGAVARFGPEVVVHLAAMVDARADRELAHRVDVGGTENVLAACLEAGVRRLVTTSSGAAYGYRADHPRWIDEETPLGAGEEFTYAWHKRLAEERLAAARASHPALEQVVLRPGTVLGRGVRTPVTRLFEGRVLLRIRGGDDRFVFIWDDDAAAAMEHALSGPAGVYNLAGDGALTVAEIARRLGSRPLTLPAGLVATGLRLARAAGLTDYGPQHIRFLQYRPVLANRRLKEDFGFTPSKTSAEAFEIYAAGRS